MAAGEPGKEILYPVATVIIGGLMSSTLARVPRPARAVLDRRPQSRPKNPRAPQGGTEVHGSGVHYGCSGRSASSSAGDGRRYTKAGLHEKEDRNEIARHNLACCLLQCIVLRWKQSPAASDRAKLIRKRLTSLHGSECAMKTFSPIPIALLFLGLVVSPLEGQIEQQLAQSPMVAAPAENYRPAGPPAYDGREQLPAGQIAPGLPPPFTLAEMERIAMANNPTLTQATMRVQALQGKQVQVGLYPNPVVGYIGDEMGNEGTAGQQGGFVRQEIVTAGKLRLDRAVAGHEISQAEFALQSQLCRVLNDVRKRL